MTATLDAAARGRATTVVVSVSGSGRAEAVDFDPVPGFSLEIPAGATSGTGTFTLTPQDDSVDEADETLSVEGSADLPVTGATLELADDDETSTSIALSAAPARIVEGGGAVEVAVTAALDAAARLEAATVQIAVSGTGVAEAVDFDPVADFAIAIAAGETEGAGTFTLTPQDDSVDEADETLSVQGSADLPVTGTEVPLTDDDEASAAVVLSVLPERIPEDGGAAAVEVTAALDGGARTLATKVNVSVTDSGQPGAVGFAEIADFEIEIPAEAQSGSGTFTVTPEDDKVDEVDAVLAVSGTSDPAGGQRIGHPGR